MKTQDWKWLTTHREGQFFERKCRYDRSGKRPKRRDARSVARDVSETLAAMTNSDGETERNVQPAINLAEPRNGRLVLSF